MPTRTRSSASDNDQPRATPPVDDTDVPGLDADVDAEIGAAVVDPDVVVIDADDLEDDDEDDDEDDEDEEEEEVKVEVKPVVRPPVRPSPGRPPGAKEEPEPPFFVGERVVLTSNVRPRTGSPIADHPIGAAARVETVLSQTAIVRFDRAPDIKEVVAFTCLDSTDDDAKARRAERDRLKEAGGA